MSRTIALLAGLLEIVLNVAGAVALVIGLILLATKGRWPEIGLGLSALVGGAAVLLAIGLASDNLAWFGGGLSRRDARLGGELCRIIGLVASLAATCVWVGFLFKILSPRPGASLWPELLWIYAVAVVASWLAAVSEIDVLASKPVPATLAPINILACHLCAAAVAGCVILGHANLTLSALVAAFLVSAAGKLTLGPAIDTSVAKPSAA